MTDWLREHETNHRMPGEAMTCSRWVQQVVASSMFRGAYASPNPRQNDPIVAANELVGLYENRDNISQLPYLEKP
jgi:hypothetical protein